MNHGVATWPALAMKLSVWAVAVKLVLKIKSALSTYEMGGKATTIDTSSSVVKVAK